MSGPKGQAVALKLSGLFTQPNTFSEVPPGLTLARATNVVLDKDSILNSRRGFAQYGVPPPSPSTLLKAFIDFKDVILVSDENGVLSYDSAGDGSVWTPYSGIYIPPSGSASADRITSYQANKNLFFATNNGVYKLEAPTTQPRLAGVSPGLGGTGVTTGAAGFMTTATNVAYRVVWGYRDLNENLVLGAPSDRIVVSNTSGADRDVNLTFFIPADITTSYFYQIYRSAGSATVNDQPDDELQLVYEDSPTAGEVLTGTVTITDSTPDNLRGSLIYTAPSLTTLGILNSNFRPPFCTTMCVFNNHGFFGNTRTKHTLPLTLIAAGSPDGVVVNDTITFSDGTVTFTITGKAAENGTLGEFKVETSLTPAENIDATARSIVNVVNTVAANTFLAAYYTSGFDELPGRMLFDRLDLSATAFTVVSNRDTAFRPVIPTSGSTYNNTSRNEVKPNRVYFSKIQEYEAVPVIQYFDIGSPEEPIRALVPLRDGIIVLKTDGVFRISGNDRASFQVNPIDTTVPILAQYSVAVLSNRVFYYSVQGIVAVSDNAAEIISRPIETELLTYSSSIYPNFNKVTFAVGYESDRKYILYTCTTSSDTYATQAYIFNTLTGQWTRWDKAASAAIRRSTDDKLYLAGPAWNTTDNYIFQERKSYNLSDFADEQYPLNVTSFSGLTLTVASTAYLEAGYTVQQVTGVARITEVVDGTTLKMETVQDWVLGAATAYRPITQSFETNQFDAGMPGIMKHWADCSLIYRSTDFTTMQLGFTADTTGDPKIVTLNAPAGVGGWGTFPWGTLPWGVSSSSRARIRTSVPKQAMRSNWLSLQASITECFTDMSLAGVSLTFSQMSSRQKSGSRV